VDRGHDSAKRRKRRREHADAADCAHTHTLSIRSQLVAGGFMGPGCARRRGAQPRTLRFQRCQPAGDDRLGSKQLKRGPGTRPAAVYFTTKRRLEQLKHNSHAHIASVFLSRLMERLASRRWPLVRRLRQCGEALNGATVLVPFLAHQAFL
jgi:hypothetical protein